MRQSNLFIAVMILGATAVLFVFGIAALAPSTDQSDLKFDTGKVLVPLKRPTYTFGNPSIGSKDAAVTIYSFGDYECAPCASLNGSLVEVWKAYPDDVRVVWKDMPNSAAHPGALAAANAARCAQEQGAFWEYHSLLMGQNGNVDAANYPLYASSLNLDGESFQSCLDSKRDIPLIERDIQEGSRLGITSTPTLFINEQRVTGDVGTDQLRSYVETELAKQGKPIHPVVQ